MKEILIIGAGKTGRGFIPQYIQNSNIYFADKNKELIETMKKTNQFKICFYGQTNKEVCVQYQDAFFIKDNDFYIKAQNVDYIFISVDVSNYDELKIDLNQALVNRIKPLSIITFENAVSASEKLYSLLSKEISCSLTILDAGVFCTTNELKELDIISQDLTYLPIQKCDHLELPLSPITKIDDFKSLMERKLYTYNCLSAVICYQGYIYQYQNLGEAANDYRIKEDIKVLLEELDIKIAHHFKISLEIQKEFSKNAVKKFSDIYLQDSIQRNARNVIRKLGKNERLLKPLQLLEDKAREILLKTIAYACYYDFCEESKAGLELLNQLDITDENKSKIKDYYQNI